MANEDRSSASDRTVLHVAPRHDVARRWYNEVRSSHMGRPGVRVHDAEMTIEADGEVLRFVHCGTPDDMRRLRGLRVGRVVEHRLFVPWAGWTALRASIVRP